MRSDYEYRTRLGEAVGAREPAFQRQRAETPKLSLRVPPSREIHLTKARNHDTQSQQAVKVNQFCKTP